MAMTVAILGGAGFIGSNLALHLQNKAKSEIVIFDNFSMGNQLERISSEKIKVTKGDATSFCELSKFLADTKPTTIYHLAANSDIASASKDSSLDIINTYMSTINLINCLKFTKASNVIFASSSAVYGEQKGKIQESVPFSPVSSYGWMKAASEVALNCAVEAGLVERLLIARFPNVTGAYQTHGVVFDLVNKIRVNESELDVLGNGYQTKPYLSASKLVETLELLLERDWRKNLTINIAPENRSNVRSIVNLILEYTGLNPKVNYEDSPQGWNGDIPSYELDTKLLKSILPSLELPSSEESILEGIHYMWHEYVQ
jgi:UDP-glucose 4-epimerase